MGNITGQVFDKDVIKQIKTRQSFLGARAKTDPHLIYGNNNNSFLRLASSVNVGTSSAPIDVQVEGNTVSDTVAQEKATGDLLSEGKNQLGERGINQNLTGMELAKACVLFGGTVGVNNSLSPKFKFGIVDNGGSGTYDYVSTIAAYGWGGISSKGFVPMPSIESADISFYNRGALQKASVKIKVFSIEQLQIFDILYLRIGYTMLLEWGHNIWLDNDLENNPNPINQRTEFVTDPFSNFFTEGKSQQDIIKSIKTQRAKENYNYDAMLGKVTNFTWKFNDDGSYDIDLNLVGLGDVIESLKVNKSNIVTNKVELTPTQLADKTKTNIASGIKATNDSDTAVDTAVEDTKKVLSDKVDAVNAELRRIIQRIKTTVNSSYGSALGRTTAGRNYKSKASSLNVVAGQDKATNTAAGNAITNFKKAFTNFKLDWLQENRSLKKTSAQFDSLYGGLKSAVDGLAADLEAALKEITGEDLASVKDAELSAEETKKQNELKRKGYDAASQRLEKEAEIRQLSPITSIETKNKTALNLQLYNWRISAQNNGDSKNLFKLTLQASSANPSSTGVDTLSLDFYYVRLGHLLKWVQDNLLYYDDTKPYVPSTPSETVETPKKANPMFEIDFDSETNFCLRFPAQFSSDPKVCVIPSNYKKDNIEWNVLPELKDYVVNGNPYAGKMMNIFVNLDYTASCLDKNTDVNGKTNLLKFLTTLFEGINDVLGNVNKLEPVFDTENNSLKIIEGSSLENAAELIREADKEDNNMAVFQVYGIGTNDNPQGSFITNVDFQVQLPPNMAAMATISAQARGNIVGENATGLSRLNKGLTDRLISVKLDKDSIEGAQSGALDPEAIFKTNIEVVSKVINTLYKDKIYAKDTIDSSRSANRDIALYLTGNDALDNKMPPPFFIPFNLSLTMTGLSGMKNYERFSITEEILPYSYRSGDQGGVIDFLIKGITHSIKDNKWETKLETLTVGSNRRQK
jgi:hypothetical protein